MKRSEIFDSFVKIAQEKGMISNDSSEAKKKIEQTGRAGSDDISTIEALYGVKPDSAKGMDYKNNIMEAAHPNSVVVSPSYDKLNGLVENNIERQNILLNIVNKPVNGLSTQHKYAETQLLLTLVRIGDELDKRDENELRALSDVCLEQTSKKSFTKTAQDPVTLTIAGIAAILGGVYLKNHMRFISDGLELDHAKLTGEIDDMLNSNSDWGVGYQYKQEFTQTMQQFRMKLDTFYKVYQSVVPVINDIEKPRDKAELIAKSKEPDTQTVQRAIAAFRTAADNLIPEIQSIIKNFSNEGFKQRQIQEKGFLSNLVDSTQILHGGKGLVGDDFDDVRHALETYLLDMGNLKKTLGDVGSVQQKITSDLQAASAKSSELFGGPEAVLNQKKPEEDQRTALQKAEEEAVKLTKSLGFGS